MYLIALTGGIAAGKSVVAARLAERGAVLVDADQVAREVVEPGTEGLARIAHEFGPTVITSEGALDRAALASIVFPDQSKRIRLNELTHPLVWKRVQERFADAEARDPQGVVVYDVPLLAEAGADRSLTFDLVVVVDAPSATRLERLMRLRGMTREEAAHRLNSQASDAERLAIADVVIDTSGTMEETLRQTDMLWDSVIKRAHRHSPMTGAVPKLE